MTELEPVTKFIDRLTRTSAKNITRDDLIRYFQEPSLGMGITPTVRAALKLFLENHL